MTGDAPRGTFGGGAHRATPRAARSSWLGAAALGARVSVGVFLLAMSLAIVSYPGGSWTSPTASGFSLARNFWCDLLRSQAINGADNASSKLLASVGFAVLGVGLLPYWWVAASLLGETGRRRVARLGTASAASLLAMAFLPSDRFPIVHGAVALGGAILGMWAAAASILERSARELRVSLRRVAGALLLVCAAGNAALYVHVAYFRGAETIAQPIVQKLATAALVVWMLGTLRLVQRRP